MRLYIVDIVADGLGGLAGQVVRVVGPVGVEGAELVEEVGGVAMGGREKKGEGKEAGAHVDQVIRPGTTEPTTGSFRRLRRPGLQLLDRPPRRIQAHTIVLRYEHVRDKVLHAVVQWDQQPGDRGHAQQHQQR
jgi:hypothetical protein